MKDLFFLSALEYFIRKLIVLDLGAETKQNLKIILNADPTDPQAKLLLGMVSENGGDYVTAIAALSNRPSCPTTCGARPR